MCLVVPERRHGRKGGAGGQEAQKPGCVGAGPTAHSLGSRELPADFLPQTAFRPHGDLLSEREASQPDFAFVFVLCPTLLF